MDNSAQRELLVSEIKTYIRILGRRGHQVTLPDLDKEELDVLRELVKELKDLARTPDA